MENDNTNVSSSESECCEEIDLSLIDNTTMFDDDSTSCSTVDIKKQNDNNSFNEYDQMSSEILKKFRECNSESNPNIFFGSLNEAIINTLFNEKNPRPLIILLDHQRSIVTNIFYQIVLCSQMILDYLSKNFVVWTWDRTSEADYCRLIDIIESQAGNRILHPVMSATIDTYPLLLCVGFDHGQIKILSTILGTMSCDQVFEKLREVRDKFDRRIESADIPDDELLLSNDMLTIISNSSDEYLQTMDKLSLSDERNVRIYKIDNPIQLEEYLNQKRIIDTRIGQNQSERVLFHGCPRNAVGNIIPHGFDHQLIGKNGTTFGCGFNFLPNLFFAKRYATPDKFNQERAILVCRVTTDPTCLGNSQMPIDYDSTTDDINAFGVYSNKQILIEYLIILE